MAGLLLPSTVTTTFDDALLARPSGTWTLIWVAVWLRIFAATPSKVTAITLPVRFVPVSVAKEPETTGPGRRFALLVTLVMPGSVTVGAGGGGGVAGAGETIISAGIDFTPALPPSMMMEA